MNEHLHTALAFRMYIYFLPPSVFSRLKPLLKHPSIASFFHHPLRRHKKRCGREQDPGMRGWREMGVEGMMMAEEWEEKKYLCNIARTFKWKIPSHRRKMAEQVPWIAPSMLLHFWIWRNSFYSKRNDCFNFQALVNCSLPTITCSFTILLHQEQEALINVYVDVSKCFWAFICWQPIHSTESFGILSLVLISWL